MAADPGLTEHQVEIPGFRIQREVGRGAASTVYLATWGDIGREVALKVAVGDAAQDPEREQRFVRESGLVADIDHPYVVKVYDAGTGTFPYIAMEYLEGGNLIARMGRGMSVPEAVGVAKTGRPGARCPERSRHRPSGRQAGKYPIPRTRRGGADGFRNRRGGGWGAVSRRDCRHCSVHESGAGGGRRR